MRSLRTSTYPLPSSGGQHGPGLDLRSGVTNIRKETVMELTSNAYHISLSRGITVESGSNAEAGLKQMPSGSSDVRLKTWLPQRLRPLPEP